MGGALVEFRGSSAWWAGIKLAGSQEISSWEQQTFNIQPKAANSGSNQPSNTSRDSVTPKQGQEQLGRPHKVKRSLIIIRGVLTTFGKNIITFAG